MSEFLKTWKKFKTIPFIDITSPEESTSGYNWARIGKSTIFDLQFNANVETFDFIEDENPTDIIKNYRPTLAQELRTVRGDKAFDAMFEYMYNLPTGALANRKLLLIFPARKTASGAGTESGYFSWLVNASLVLSGFNTVDEKITFNINFAGDVEKGSATGGSSGTPIFTPFEDQESWMKTPDAVEVII